ncbi:MAG TPA: penicillin-binding protein activator LpoB [Salinibacter sp.]|nr:penicillin-binding protein activator LpoB [Salinibacter sp.]
MRPFFVVLVSVMTVAGMTGCGSSSSVKRVEADKQTDLSGRWNDTDARMVAEDMVSDVLGAVWLERYRRNNDAPPTVIVGPIRNKTMQHIDEEIFIKDLERELVNSGRVQFVAAKDERQAVRAERRDQQQYATMETAARMAQETGADYMLLGTISSNVQENQKGDKMSLFYVVNLELIDMTKNTKAWIGTKKIKKIVERDRVRL